MQIAGIAMRRFDYMVSPDDTRHPWSHSVDYIGLIGEQLVGCGYALSVSDDDAMSAEYEHVIRIVEAVR
jgi:hypothetical protein